MGFAVEVNELAQLRPPSKLSDRPPIRKARAAENTAVHSDRDVSLLDRILRLRPSERNVSPHGPRFIE